MSDNPTFGPKITCFAANGAIQFEATQRHKQGEPVAQTISIEMCPVINRQPNWKAKLSLQLGPDELPIFAAVLLGYLPKCEFKRPEKGIYIERQKGRIYYKGTAGMGNLFQVPVPIGKTYNVSQLVLMQLTNNGASNDSAFVLAGIRGASSLYETPQSAS